MLNRFCALVLTNVCVAFAGNCDAAAADPPVGGVPQLLQQEIQAVSALQNSVNSLQNTINAIQSTINALAATGGLLVTSPFPGDVARPAFAKCLATNVGADAAAVTISVVEPDGSIITSQTVTVDPGHTTSGSISIGLNSGFHPAVCTFGVAVKANWRASMTVDGLPNSAVVVIPAQ